MLNSLSLLQWDGNLLGHHMFQMFQYRENIENFRITAAIKLNDDYDWIMY